MREQTGDIITFSQFVEGDLLYENCDDTESGNKYDDDSTMPPLISEEKMDVMDSGDESEDEPMSTEMLEDIRNGSNYHPGVNKIETRYKRHDHIKQS